MGKGAEGAVESQKRTAGGVEYTLTRKKVKNLNLRVRPDGSVAVSAPRKTPLKEVDGFVTAHLEWIAKAQSRVDARQKKMEETPLPTKEECMALFEPVSERIYPAFAQVLEGQKPRLVVRDMTSRWGVCHIQKRQITLAQRLALKPMAAVEYVVLHEYCHFVHPDHQKEFWALVERFMPDWKARRALLKEP